MSTYRYFAIFLISFVLRLVLGWPNLIHLDHARTPDSIGYLRLAEELRHGSFPSFFRTPGYPLFLAFTGASHNSTSGMTLIAQMLLDSGTGVLLAALAWRLWRRSEIALCTGLLWAFCPVAAVMSCQYMSESLYLALTAAALYLALRSPSWVGAIAQGVCWGAATLTRPAGLFMPFIACFFFAIRSDPVHTRRWAVQAAAAAIYVSTIAGWIGFNYARSGHAVFSLVPYVNYYTYEYPCVKMVDELSWSSYAQLWVLNPRKADLIRQKHEASLVKACGLGKGAGSASDVLWAVSDDPATVFRLRTEAASQLRGRFFTLLGIHAVGVLPTLRPIPPWKLGGMIATLVDCFRLFLLPVAFLVLVFRRWYWFLGFVTVWAVVALLLPGPFGMWRYRAMAEPVFTLVLAAAFAPALFSTADGSRRRWGIRSDY